MANLSRLTGDTFDDPGSANQQDRKIAIDERKNAIDLAKTNTLPGMSNLFTPPGGMPSPLQRTPQQRSDYHQKWVAAQNSLGSSMLNRGFGDDSDPFARLLSGL